MKFSQIANTLAFASTAFAAPATHRRKGRTVGAHGNPIKLVDGPANINKSDISYFTNWAGAVLVGTSYTKVTGSFVVPSPSTTGSGSA
jgi:hypothetical protein